MFGPDVPTEIVLDLPLPRWGVFSGKSRARAATGGCSCARRGRVYIDTRNAASTHNRDTAVIALDLKQRLHRMLIDPERHLRHIAVV
jgi:hypothetical protein